VLISELDLGGVQKLHRFALALGHRQKQIRNGVYRARIRIIASVSAIFFGDFFAPALAFFNGNHVQQ
jgi:hypothetical protein